MKPTQFGKQCSLYHGDCIEVMQSFPSKSFTAVVTDPPYALAFHGRDWDTWETPEAFERFCEDWAREAKRVLKPGGLLLSFCGTRTEHRMMCGIEDAGLYIMDKMLWCFASGWPKGKDISKAIDKKLGHTRERIKLHKPGEHIRHFFGRGKKDGEATSDVPITAEATPWVGWNTTLKPAYEPICVSMRPFKGTYAENALRYGVAGINVDGTRIPGTAPRAPVAAQALFEANPKALRQPKDLWPSNVAVDEEVDALFRGQGMPRFWYTAKSSNDERDAGGWAKNTHVSVKPLSLMQWLVRMVRQPEGTRILDPFTGSGSTLVACLREGVDVVGIEREKDYLPIIEARIRPELRKSRGLHPS